MNKGDINNDDVLNINDTETLMNNVVKKKTIDQSEIKNGDLNNDNVINLVDVINLSRAIGGEKIAYEKNDNIITENINTNQTGSTAIAIPGPPGKDGINGKDSKDGKDGIDGKDGPTKKEILESLTNDADFILKVVSVIRTSVSNEKIKAALNSDNIVDYY